MKAGKKILTLALFAAIFGLSTDGFNAEANLCALTTPSLAALNFSLQLVQKAAPAGHDELRFMASSH